jgi:histidinol dehydrogenase
MNINLWKLGSLSKGEKAAILRRAETDIAAVAAVVMPIIEDVRTRGDEALRYYAEKLDGAAVKGGLKAADEDFAKAYQELDPQVTAAIRTCAEHVKIHHRQQMERVERQWMKEVKPGIFAGEKVTPIPSAGLYVPRGKGAFPSVMYMLCLPAVIAGVKTIAVCTPPTPEGGLDAASLVAADVCGVRSVYKAGGAQAIAALAYGTQTIPKVAQVNGPGSPYVAAAKRLLANVIDPGMLAGPSEAIILADQTADPWNTALDLINEAEHGPDSASILVTTSQDLAGEVMQHLSAIIAGLPPQRRDFCNTVFSRYGGILVCETMEEAIDFCNEYAVEHLLMKVKEPDAILSKLENCGEILIGETTPIVMGNYGIGINAVLPTGQNAFTHDCTSVWTFLKRTSLSYVTASGYRTLKRPVELLADYEGFVGHAEVLRARREQTFKDLSLAAVAGENTKLSG